MSTTEPYTDNSNLKLTVREDHQAIALEAAHHIADELRKNPKLVLGLATGATMEPVYAELVRLRNHPDPGQEPLDFSQARFFNLDSYKGIPSSDRNSYDNQLRKLLISKVNANPENVNFVQGIDFDPKEYERKIKEAGGIDIQLLGLGGEGHIGFNEVGSTLDSRTREVHLHDRTREDNAMYFNKPGEKVPESSYTMGIGTILEAKEILVLANNPNKAWAVRNMMDASGTRSQDFTSLELHHLQKLQHNGAVDIGTLDAFFEAQAATARKPANPVEELPARALHHHKKVTFLVDKEAASMTRLTDLVQKSNLKRAEVEALLDRFSPRELEVTIGNEKKTLFLPAGFDFYDPKTMGIDEKFDPKNHRHVEALQNALAHTTDTGIGAHQDDIEIMAGPQLLKAAAQPDRGWMTIIVTDGAASKSILTGTSTRLSPKELTDMRQREQREAAQEAGTPVIQLKYPSASVNGHMGEGKRQEVAFALGTLFSAMPKLENAYGHNPIDKHATHLGVLAVQTAALRAAKPPHLKDVYAMEVWGGLTGLPESMLSMGVVENDRDLAKITKLVGYYRSQIEGQGRDYAKTTTARIEGHGGYVSNPHLANPPVGMVIGINVTDFTKGTKGDYSETSNDMGALAHHILTRAAEMKVKMASHHPIPGTPDLAGGFRGSLLSRSQSGTTQIV